VKLEGLHHITAITADAQRNVDFYVGLLGLRLVKKSVNQDSPSVYHLFYADEKASAGADITFFEFPGAPVGRAGAGMVHRVVWRVGATEALDFWASRLEGAGYESQREGERLRFADYEGLAQELVVSEAGDEPLIAEHPEIPAELALQGFDAVRAYAAEPDRSRETLEETLGFRPTEDGWEVRGERRGGLYAYDEPPAESPLQGGGTIHHVAWSSPLEDHEAWQQRAAAAGLRPTPVVDRFYFRSVYFREPSGVLFEIATLGPGFAVDEPQDQLGEKLALPPFLEHLRDEIEPTLTPLRNPREVSAGDAA
jgi:glyoxalase family protein